VALWANLLHDKHGRVVGVGIPDTEPPAGFFREGVISSL
jgi:hypothetical protein